jgi:phage-related protein
MTSKYQGSLYALVVLLAAISVTASSEAPAWSADWKGPYHRRAGMLTRAQESRLDQFLRNHRGVARDLQRNPDLANDRSYLRRHDDFREFLSDHAGIRAAFRANPSAAMSSHGYAGPGGSWDRDRWSSDRDRWRGRYR